MSLIVLIRDFEKAIVRVVQDSSYVTLSSSLSELSQAGNELSQQYQTLTTSAKSLSEGMRLFVILFPDRPL